MSPCEKSRHNWEIVQVEGRPISIQCRSCKWTGAIEMKAEPRQS